MWPDVVFNRTPDKARWKSLDQKTENFHYCSLCFLKIKKTRPRLSNSDTAVAASANVMGSSFPFFMQQPLNNNNNNKYKADSIPGLAENELEQFQMRVQVQEALLSPKGNFVLLPAKN